MHLRIIRCFFYLFLKIVFLKKKKKHHTIALRKGESVREKLRFVVSRIDAFIG